MKFTASTILSIPLLLTTITFAAPTPGDPNWCSTAAVDNAAPGSVAYNNAVEALNRCRNAVGGAVSTGTTTTTTTGPNDWEQGMSEGCRWTDWRCYMDKYTRTR